MLLQCCSTVCDNIESTLNQHIVMNWLVPPPRRCTNVMQMFCVCWDVTAILKQGQVVDDMQMYTKDW